MATPPCGSRLAVREYGGESHVSFLLHTSPQVARPQPAPSRHLVHAGRHLAHARAVASQLRCLVAIVYLPRKRPPS